MQAAFVDIGLERAAFIHASEVAPQGGKLRADKNSSEPSERPIYELLHEGQSVVVQVTKTARHQGCTTLTYISFLHAIVYMPKSDHLGISYA